MTHRLLAALFVTATAFVLVARAEPGLPIKPITKGDTSSTVPKDETDPKARIDDAANQQDRLKRQFEEFKLSLLRLAQRMENSARQEDKDKAAVLKEALAKASEMGTDQKFGTLISSLKSSETFKDTDKLSDVIGRNDELRKDLNTLIEMLQKDDKEADLRRRRLEVTRMLEQLKEIIAKEERVRTRIDLARQKPTEIKPDQDKANTDMKKLAGVAPKKTDTSKSEGKLPPKSDSKDGKPGEAKADAKDPKGEERPREGKPNDNKETKPGDGKETKPGDPKPGDGKEAKPGDGKEAKPGDAKENKSGDKPDSKPSDPKDGKGGDKKDSKPSDGKPNDGKPGDPKPGEGKPAESKPGDGKESKGGDTKESKPSDAKPSESKPGEPKPGEGKPGEGKPGEAKPGESKPGDSKVTKPSDAKPGEGKPNAVAKPGDPKPGEGKPGAGKPGDPKPGEAKPGEGKPGDAKPSDSKAKGDGKSAAKPGSGKPGDAKPGEGKPSSSSGKPSDAKPGEGKPGGGSGSPPPGGKPPPPPPPSETDPARKKIKDAADSGDKASNELEKNKADQAGPKVDDAIDKLNQAKKQLEDLLKQLREQEVERILAQLQGRCEKMLAMQIAVRDGTVILDKNVKGHEDQKPTRVDEQTSNGLADKEDAIVKEASSAIRIIEAEGSAIAFAEVFKQVREDMVTVKGRLDKTDAGVVTVQIENDIIATLQEMVEALKKARKDAKASPPKPPGPPGKPPKPGLIDEIAELKMIRSMQDKVNKRTQIYGKQYPGEQLPVSVPDPKVKAQMEAIRQELQDLSKRQDKIHKITDDIAKGKGKNND